MCDTLVPPPPPTITTSVKLYQCTICVYISALHTHACQAAVCNSNILSHRGRGSYYRAGLPWCIPFGGGMCTEPPGATQLTPHVYPMSF